MKVYLPDHIPALLNKVPEQDQPKGEEEAKFWRAVAYELAQLLKEAASVEEASIEFADFRKAGEQYIWEFAANNLSLPVGNSMNWHGQNTSRWLYAGCILLHNGKVSTHH